MKYPQNNNGELEYNDSTAECLRSPEICGFRMPGGCPNNPRRGLKPTGKLICNPNISEFGSCKPVCNDIGAVNWSPSSETNDEENIPTT